MKNKIESYPEYIARRVEMSMNKDVKIHNPENIPEEIVDIAIDMMEEEEKRKVVSIEIRRTENPDEYGITPTFEKVPFQRIRRITGYLVGDVSRFNNGKRAEEKDRVKHGMEEER